MNLSRNLLRSVLFVGSDDDTQRFTPKGTAFLAQFEGSTYLVTARHVAEQLGNDDLQLRVNRLDGGSDVVTVSVPLLDAPWRYYPDDDTVDLAVLLFESRLNPRVYEAANIPAEMFVSEDLRASWGLGLAETCYAVGLFGRAPGEDRNLPVVHTGNIAAMPDGKNIRVASSPGVTHMTNGYLVSASNLGGLSGAPVFVRPSVVLGGQVVHDRRLMGHSESVYLLGIWQGSWTEDAREQGIRVPVGMGIVTPSMRLIELLSTELLTVERNRANAAVNARLKTHSTIDEFFLNRPGLVARRP